MADQERRGDSRDEHAWAELTWTKLFRFVFYGWCFGVMCGIIFAAIGVWTNWYYLVAVAFGQTIYANWWLIPVIFVLVGLAVYVNRPRKKGVKKRENQEQANQQS